MADIRDLEEFLRVAPDVVLKYVTPAMFAAGNKMQVAAQISITDGAVSGANHVASLPGEPPNNDTGVLANNIETVLINPLKVEVSSNAPYAARLEFGGAGSKGGYIAPRPYMEPAANAKRKEARDLVARAVGLGLRAAKSKARVR